MSTESDPPPSPKKKPKSRSKKRSRDADEEGSKKRHKVAPEAPAEKVLKEMRKTNKILANLTNRIKSTEKRVKQIEEQMSSRSSSSTDAQVTPKRKSTPVPDEVRVSSYLYNM